MNVNNISPDSFFGATSNPSNKAYRHFKDYSILEGHTIDKFIECLGKINPIKLEDYLQMILEYPDVLDTASDCIQQYGSVNTKRILNNDFT